MEGLSWAAAKDAHGERLAWRAKREAELGHRLAGRTLKAPPERVSPQTKVNITDLDSRSVKAQQGFLQGYNAQAAATSEQIIIAAEILGNANDYGMLEAMKNAAVGELAAAGVSEQIDVALANAGYWTVTRSRTSLPEVCGHSCRQTAASRSENGAQTAKAPATTSCAASSKARQTALYRQRKHAIEPIFGQIKHNE